MSVREAEILFHLQTLRQMSVTQLNGLGYPVSRCYKHISSGRSSIFASIQTGTVGFTFIYVVQVVGVYNYECTIHSGMTGSISVVSNVKQISSIVDVFELKQNFPNPFNPETKIKFSIPSNEFVTLSVYDLSGKEVANLVKNNLTAGVYEYDFNGANLSSGIYFYTIRAGNFTETKRMILVK